MFVLLSDTPVAGTVTRISQWMENEFGVDVLTLVRRNYPHNAFSLPHGAFGALPDWQSFIYENVKRANAVFVHNVYEKSILECVFASKKCSAPIFFHYHSPPQEPPAYQYSILTELSFDHIFAVAQGHGRFVEKATPVPNIVPDFCKFMRVTKSSDIFIPHLRSTGFRWSRKFLPSDMEYIQKHKNLYQYSNICTIKSVFGREAVTFGEIQLYLQCCLAVIDDINTGLFHQATLEGLKAGCGVFCAADLVSQEEFCVAANSDPLPLIQVSGINEVVSYLASPNAIKDLQRFGLRAREYAQKFLGEERLGKRHCEILRPFLA